MSNKEVVIVGTGQAGYQVAVSLRSLGFQGHVRLVGDDPHLPYQRPPLSKAFLAGACDKAKITFQNESFYLKHDIELIRGRKIVSIDRPTRTVVTEDLARMQYDHLVLAVGARPRPMPRHPFISAGLHELRSLSDAETLRAALDESRHVVIVGGGFLGLEFAAVAAAEGKAVTVIETSVQLMGRAVSAPVAAAFRKHHEERGVSFLLGDSVNVILNSDSHVTGIRTEQGRLLDADLVVVCAGVVPNVDLAEKAGLKVDNGIVVDACLRTDDTAISALGDCASFPSRFSIGRCRPESIQNAMDQARHVAQRLVSGVESVFDVVPWFWSDQAGLKLQIAGLNHGVDHTIVCGDVEARRFSVYGFRQNRLVTVESVASPADHLAGRRLLATGTAVTPSEVGTLCDAGVPVESFHAKPG
jgi:3-phenylpropionate/trans-cinnamate dioxygenase ferredoxin reductase subunit